jgi:hypothetical protein
MNATSGHKTFAYQNKINQKNANDLLFLLGDVAVLVNCMLAILFYL